MKKLKAVTILLLALFFMLDFFLIQPHAFHGWWQHIKGFNILLGVFGGLLLMGIAKALGTFWLYRKENYYD